MSKIQELMASSEGADFRALVGTVQKMKNLDENLVEGEVTMVFASSVWEDSMLTNDGDRFLDVYAEINGELCDGGSFIFDRELDPYEVLEVFNLSANADLVADQQIVVAMDGEETTLFEIADANRHDECVLGELHKMRRLSVGESMHVGLFEITMIKKGGE